jgi:hypothetical protein
MSRPKHTTPALILLCAACLLPLLLPTAASATTTIYVNGYGGYDNGVLCPHASEDRCGTITITEFDPLHGVFTDLQNNQYDVELNTPIPPGTIEMQGGDLNIKSVSPR